jgi:hypothetical protein
MVFDFSFTILEVNHQDIELTNKLFINGLVLKRSHEMTLLCPGGYHWERKELLLIVKPLNTRWSNQ